VLGWGQESGCIYMYSTCSKYWGTENKGPKGNQKQKKWLKKTYKDVP